MTGRIYVFAMEYDATSTLPEITRFRYVVQGSTQKGTTQFANTHMVIQFLAINLAENWNKIPESLKQLPIIFDPDSDYETSLYFGLNNIRSCTLHEQMEFMTVLGMTLKSK